MHPQEEVKMTRRDECERRLLEVRRQLLALAPVTTALSHAETCVGQTGHEECGPSESRWGSSRDWAARVTRRVRESRWCRELLRAYDDAKAACRAADSCTRHSGPNGMCRR